MAWRRWLSPASGVRGELPLALLAMLMLAIPAGPHLLLQTQTQPMMRASAQSAPQADDFARPPRLVAERAPAPVPRIADGIRTPLRVVALTFDLDMTLTMAADLRAGTSWFNADALAYLRSQHVHATMFMTGMWAETYPVIARQIAQDAEFEIANHSFSHPAFHLPCYQLGSVSRSDQAMQIQMAQQAIRWVTGVTPRYFRFPGGCYDRQALDLVHAAGLIPVEWNVNSIDAFNPYAEQIASVVLSEVKPGSIVIMHLQGGVNAPATAEALRMIVPALEQRGYQFVTVGELLATGPPIQPTDPREVVEAAPPSTPSPVVRPAAAPTAHWCGWVRITMGSVWVCH